MKAAFEILDTDDKLKAIDTKMKFFEEHDVVPPDLRSEPEESVSSNPEAELIKRTTGHK
ncbi:MAG: hypothetical protein M0P58_08375 [Bacteroidales bacterium]|nr:hypothetical protein [Bacteroidales bacterium]